MKSVLKKVVFLLFFANVCLVHAQSLSSERFLDLVFSEDIMGIRLFFIEMEQNPPTLVEGKIFIEEISKRLSSFYDIPLSRVSLETISKKVKKELEIFKGISLFKISRIPFKSILKTGCQFFDMS